MRSSKKNFDSTFQKYEMLNIAKKSVITNSKLVTQKKSADSCKDNYGDRNWIFVKFINKVSQKWKNYRNSRVLPSIRLQDGSSSKIRTLFWNCQAEYNNYKMKKMVPVNQCHSHLIRHLEDCCDIFSLPSRREWPPSIWDTHGISERFFCKSRVIPAHMCVKLQMRLYVCRRVGSSVGPVWVQFGSSLGPVWVQFGSSLGPVRVQFGSSLGPVWVQFGSISGSISGPFRVHFGSISGPFRDHCVVHFWVFRVSISN